MSIISIQRDTNNNLSIVRLTVSDTLATVSSGNYILNNQSKINDLNSGLWQWFTSDLVLVAASNGNGFFEFTNSTFSTLTAVGGGAGNVTFTGDTGTPFAGSSVTLSGNSTGLTFNASSPDLTLGGILNGAHGGTGIANTGKTINLGSPTSGFVLTSDSGGNATWQANTGSADIHTIDGDSGSITGTTVTVYANNAALNSGSSVSFVNSGTVSTLNVTDNNSNTIIGLNSGVLSNSAIQCVSLGANTLTSITDDQFLVAIGYSALQFANDSEKNVAIGSYSLNTLVSGGDNTAIGDRCGLNLASGNFNVLFGSSTAVNYTGTESSNIIICNPGVLGESNVMRLGTSGSSNFQVSTTFIAGINGNTLSGTPLMVTIDSSTDQLGVQAIPAGISTINGDTGSITGTTVTIHTNNSALNCGASVEFVNSGSISTLNVTDGNFNTIIGNTAGNLGLTGGVNTGFGAFSLTASTSGNRNAAFGCNSLQASSTDSDNSGFGYGSLNACNGGGGNCALGSTSLESLSSGNFNLAAGFHSGSALVGAESSNIYLNSVGVISESHCLRIGAGTGTANQQLSTSFISGINGNTVGSAMMVTIDSATDQLGVLSLPTGVIANIAGDSGSITGSNVTIFANNVSNNCGSSIKFVNSGTTSQLNVADGNNNVMFGRNAGNLTVSGASNSAFGFGALNSVQGGSSNSAFGLNALNSLTSGSDNMAIGQSCLTSLQSGIWNVAVGLLSGASITTGSYNLFFGVLAGATNTLSDSSNIYFQHNGNVGESNTLRVGTVTGTGSQQLSRAFISGINGNTLGGTPLMVTIDSATDQLGVQSISPVSITITGDTGSISGSSLTIFSNQSTVNSGSSVSFNNTGSVSTLNVTDSNSNTIIGNGSGNTTISGGDNIGLGQSVLSSLTMGFENVAIGNNALKSTMTGVSCTAIGWSALTSFLTGNSNIAIGRQALFSLTAANFNTAIGDLALTNSVTDPNNTGIGANALQGVNGGSDNTAIGYAAGPSVVTGSYNCYFGSNSGAANSGAESSNICVNSSGATGESNTLRLGMGTGIGTQQLSTAFISGINGNTVSSARLVTIDSSTDQLGTIPIPAVFTWSDQSSPFTASSDNGYFITAALTVTLPASPVQGDQIDIVADVAGVGSVIVLANTGQFIRVGAGISSSAGNASNTSIGDTLQLVYRAASTTWVNVGAPQGSWILT